MRAPKRLSAKIQRLIGPSQPLSKGRKTKYGNVKTVVDGLTFDSKREAARWVELRAIEQDGSIQNLRRQVPLRIRINGTLVAKYIADFSYLENGAMIYEDSKGFRTATYRLKAKLVKAALGIVIRET